jgi:lipopolysaccharide heptosyltransferase II
MPACRGPDRLPLKLLIVKLADLGDALTATPALRSLRQTWPGARIDVLTSPIGREGLEGLDSLDRIYVADKHRFDTAAGVLSPVAWRALLPLLRDLRCEHYDQLLLMHHLTKPFGLAKYRQLARAIGAHRTVGLDNGRGGFLDVRVPDNGFGDLHEVDYCLRVAEAAGATPLADPRLEMAIDEASEARAEKLLSSDREPKTQNPEAKGWIALHPGGGAFSLARRWSPAGFAEVGQAMAEHTGAKLAIVGSDVDAEMAVEVDQILGGRALNLVGQTSVKEAAAVLGRCRLLVSNDSGMVALATAAGTPVAAVFGPSNDRAWGPYPPSDHRVVRVTLPCSPCFYRGKSLGTPEGCPTRDCLALVTPEMVIESALSLWERSRERVPN